MPHTACHHRATLPHIRSLWLPTTHADSCLPCFVKGRESVQQFSDRFQLSLTEDQLTIHVEQVRLATHGRPRYCHPLWCARVPNCARAAHTNPRCGAAPQLIQQSLDNMRTKLYDRFQYMTNGIH